MIYMWMGWDLIGWIGLDLYVLMEMYTVRSGWPPHPLVFVQMHRKLILKTNHCWHFTIYVDGLLKTGNVWSGWAPPRQHLWKLNKMLILKVNHLLFIHQQNGSIVQNVDSEGMPISTNLVIKRDRNNKWNGKSAPSISTNLLIYQMGQPSRL